MGQAEQRPVVFDMLEQRLAQLKGRRALLKAARLALHGDRESAELDEDGPRHDRAIRRLGRLEDHLTILRRKIAVAAQACSARRPPARSPGGGQGPADTNAAKS
jgi:hypothetical protein